MRKNGNLTHLDLVIVDTFVEILVQLLFARHVDLHQLFDGAL